MTNRLKYENSEVVQFFKEMPKGAHLHLHNFAAGCFRKFADILIVTENLYVYLGDKSSGKIRKANVELEYGSFHFFKPGSKRAKQALASDDFKLTKNCSKAFIYGLIALPESFASAEEEQKYLKNQWGLFQACWGRIMNVVHAVPFYDGKDSFFYTLLEDQYTCGVRYLELRTTAGEVYTDRYDPVSAKEYLKVVKKTVALFQQDHPDFLGCKIIFSSLKLQTNEEIEKDVALTIELNNDPEVGDIVGGFDLVGHEDGLRPLSDYVEQLKACEKAGVDLLLHAGETHDSDSFQMYDAVLLGTKRLGHAYDLINHPELMKRVVANDIVVECCPISNQGLGYVSDMRNHNAKTMIKHGVKVTISSDDPGMFHYFDVSYDFAVAFKSWNLTLMQVKMMIKQSYSASTMAPELVAKGEENFKKDWKQFIDNMLLKYKDYAGVNH